MNGYRVTFIMRFAASHLSNITKTFIYLMIPISYVHPHFLSLNARSAIPSPLAASQILFIQLLAVSCSSLMRISTFFTTSSSSAVCSTSSSIHTCARPFVYRCNEAFAGVGIISNTLRSASSSAFEAFEASRTDLVQGINSVENVTSKPR